MVKVKFISLKKAEDGKHKYIATVLNEETGRQNNIKFGAFGASDYTKHKDIKQKTLYETRHIKREDWTNPLTAGFWSKWILWNKVSVDDSLKATIKQFNL